MNDAPNNNDEYKVVTIDTLGVGYWREFLDSPGLEGEWLPHPEELVDPSWCVKDRKKIASYLRSGICYESYRGYSFCRFNCGIPHRLMGSSDRTDGHWTWPEGLPHYVETHDVKLPDEFVEFMCQANWRVPRGRTGTWVRTNLELDYWRSWAAQQIKPV